MNNEDLLNTYLKYLQPTLIFEQDEDLDQQDLDLEDADSDAEDEQTSEQDTDESAQQQDTDQQSEDAQENAEQKTDATTSQKKSDTDLKFSADLASQFGNTVNKFTRAAAQVIKQRTINKEQSDNIYNLMGKIKDLLDAASKSV